MSDDRVTKEAFDDARKFIQDVKLGMQLATKGLEAHNQILVGMVARMEAAESLLMEIVELHVPCNQAQYHRDLRRNFFLQVTIDASAPGADPEQVAKKAAQDFGFLPSVFSPVPADS